MHVVIQLYAEASQLVYTVCLITIIKNKHRRSLHIPENACMQLPQITTWHRRSHQINRRLKSSHLWEI